MSSPARGSIPARRGRRTGGTRAIMEPDPVRPTRRFRLRAMRIALGILAAAFAASVQGGQCVAKSGPKTAALVELYTSEGCSSCPPADKRLSQFPAHGHSLEQVVPISLHVDYWDDLGWKEPFAQPQFSERQSWLVHANGHKTVFTPHFFVSGTEVRDWHGDLDDELKRIV